MENAKYEFEIMESQCSDYLDEIETIISPFKQTFNDSWKDIDF